MIKYIIISALLTIGCGKGAKATQAQCEKVADHLVAIPPPPGPQVGPTREGKTPEELAEIDKVNAQAKVFDRQMLLQSCFESSAAHADCVLAGKTWPDIDNCGK